MSTLQGAYDGKPDRFDASTVTGRPLQQPNLFRMSTRTTTPIVAAHFEIILRCRITSRD